MNTVIVNLNRGENIIRKDLTCLGIQMVNRQWFQERNAVEYVELYINGKKVGERVYKYLLAGERPFPCEFKIPANSVVKLEIFGDKGTNVDIEKVALFCTEGLYGDGEGYLYGFEIFPDNDSELAYATIKPFSNEKWVIKNWTFFMSVSRYDGPMFPYGYSDKYGLIDITRDEIPFIEKISIDTVFSKRDYYRDLNIEFKKLLYFKVEPTKRMIGGNFYNIYPFVLAFIKCYELKDNESRK